MLVPSERCEAEFPPSYSPSFWWLVGNHCYFLAYRSLPSFHLASHLCGLLSPKFLLSGHQSYWVGDPPLCVCVCVCVCSQLLSRGRLFVTPWTVATRLQCPWNSPGKNTRVGSQSILQRIFSTQGSKQGLLHCRRTLYHLSYLRSPATF